MHNGGHSEHITDVARTLYLNRAYSESDRFEFEWSMLMSVVPLKMVPLTRSAYAIKSRTLLRSMEDASSCCLDQYWQPLYSILPGNIDITII